MYDSTGETSNNNKKIVPGGGGGGSMERSNLFSSPNSINVIKSKGMTWSEHETTSLQECLKGRYHFGDLHVHGS
jgi:hypothetical protein